MGQKATQLYAGYNHGVIWNKSDKTIVYELDGFYESITQDHIDKEFNPQFKGSPADFDISLGKFQRGIVVAHNPNKLVVKVRPSNIGLNGLHKVQIGKTRLSIRFSEEKDYIFQDLVINSMEDLRVIIYKGGQTGKVSLKTTGKLINQQTENASLEADKQINEPDQDDLEFQKACENSEGGKEEH